MLCYKMMRPFVRMGLFVVYNPMLSNYTYLMLYTFFCRLQISKGIASLRRIAIALPCFSPAIVQS